MFTSSELINKNTLLVRDVSRLVQFCICCIEFAYALFVVRQWAVYLSA